jgi:hypothetical protein
VERDGKSLLEWIRIHSLRGWPGLAGPELGFSRTPTASVLRNEACLRLPARNRTSFNHHALYGIMCFFRSKKNTFCKLLLGLPQLAEHFGTLIAGDILTVLDAFGIPPEKIGYFTLDNAENNTTAMVAIGERLGFNGRLRRGRCISHTINLAARALLFGNNSDAFKAQLDGTSLINHADYQIWRTQGPVGKLHNLVVDMRNMHKLYYGFLKAQKEAGITILLRLIIDNETRWLLQLYMIRRAIQLKTLI